MKPFYEHYCAEFCQDRTGKRRTADRWVHIRGRTLWVCEPCAERLGRENGLPSSRARAGTRVLKGQLSLLEPELEASLEWTTLDPVPETHSQHLAQGES